MIKPEFSELRELAILAYGKSSDYKSIVNFPFEVASSFLDKYAEAINTFGLTPAEVLALGMLQGFHYRELQDSQVNNKFIEQVRNALDSALVKIPRTRFEVVIRNDGYLSPAFFKKNYKVGDVYVHPCSLTASKDDFGNRDFKFIIKPLTSDRTKAHDIFLVYNHGTDCHFPEYQVQFERDARFMIDQIAGNTVYLSEIE